MDTNENLQIEKKLDTVIDLLRHLLALELARAGATQADIGKHLHVAKASVVEMLKGLKKEGA
jgi:Mn-dependent DtxR family transcriptional regulator